jgi:hypothetical protein
LVFDEICSAECDAAVDAALDAQDATPDQDAVPDARRDAARDADLGLDAQAARDARMHVVVDAAADARPDMVLDQAPPDAQVDQAPPDMADPGVCRPEICGDGVDQDCDDAIDEEECCGAVFRLTRRYLVCNHHRTYDAARAECQAYGMDLAVVDDLAESVWLMQSTAERVIRRAWIGLREGEVEGDWRWLDGRVPAVDAWAGGEPNNGEGFGGEESCGEFYVGSGWNDVPCDMPRQFTCELPCDVDIDGDGVPGCGEDCDDSDANIGRGSLERCADGIDQDCDGAVDEARCDP